MTKSFVTVVFCALLSLSLAGITLANGALSDNDAPAIMVSPSTIVLAKVNTISVHTNIPASVVVPASLELNGAAPMSVYVDNLGHIAAKFAVADLNLQPGRAILTLTGNFDDGANIFASDVVTVR